MSSKRDYYEVLGVSKTSSDDEIKKAYRKLAMRFHPDRQAGKSDAEKKEAEDKFKEAAEAFEVLSDKNKRQQYDQFGFSQNQSGGFNGSGFDVNDFLRRHSGMFGGMFGGRNPFAGFGEDFGFAENNQQQEPTYDDPENGRDVQIKVSLDFKDALFGAKKTFDIKLSDQCPECNGHGYEKGTTPEKCPTCKGSGSITKRMQQGFMISMTTSVCPECHGRGYKFKICKKCNGSKRVLAEKHIKVSIPPGIDDGQSLRVRSQGECGVKGGENGDLFIRISLQQSDIFERHGLDLKTTLFISPVLASFGGNCKVITPLGYKDINVPKNVISGKILKLEGLGVKNQTGKCGDLYVEVKIESLANLTTEQQKLLKKLQDTITLDNLKNASDMEKRNLEFLKT